MGAVTLTLADRLPLGAVRRTSDGYLVADAKVARTGVQEYLGSEVGRPEQDIVRVYRPPESVFAQDVMHSYAHRPVTNDHPPEQEITPANWKDHAVGTTGGEVARDGEFVRVPLVLMDGAAISAFDAGKRELSMGYTASLTFQDGVTPEGQAYDAVMGPAKMNHLALVDRARGGEHLRIGDRLAPVTPSKAQPNGGPDMDPKLQTVFVDGLSVTTTDQGAQAINKLNDSLKAKDAEIARLNDAHTKALADANTALAKAEAERDDAKGKILDAASIDKLVAERADLVATAKTLHDADYSGKSPADIRRIVVQAKLGDSAVTGKADAYIEARFDMLAEDGAAGGDPLRTAMRGNDGKPAQRQEGNGQTAYEQRMADAWKGAPAAK